MLRSVRSPLFDEFEDAMRGVDGRYLLIGRNAKEWRIKVLDLGDVTLMLGRNGADAVYHGACIADGFGLFLSFAHRQRLMVNGQPMGERDFAWLPPRGEFCVPSGQGLAWMGVSIARHRLSHLMEDGASGAAAKLHTLHLARAEAAALERVQRLARGAFRTAATLHDPQGRVAAFEMLQAQLVDAGVDLLQPCGGAVSPRAGRPRIERREVVDRVVRFMEERIDHPIQLGDFCAQAGVSVATLHNVFTERFGVSPHRYLMLRRLHAIHAALRDARPDDTVSSICARYGVWDFGRFAHHYKRVFGLRPSQALGRRSVATRTAVKAAGRGRR